MRLSVNKLLCFLVLPALLLTSGAFGAEEPAPVTPDLAALQQESLKLAAEAKSRFHGDFSSKVKKTEFCSIQRANNLLPNYVLPYPLIYIIHIAEHAEWYKQSLQYILVLRVEDNGFKPLLVYCGGLNENTLKYQVLDLGDKRVVKEETASLMAYSFSTLYIEDCSSGNGWSLRRILLFRYDEKLDHFYNIFNQNVTQFPPRSQKPYETFKSTVEFHKNSNKLKDIVINTKWLVEIDDYSDSLEDDSKCVQSVSVFKWNGKCYEGEFNAPEKADLPSTSRGVGRWFPELTESP